MTRQRKGAATYHSTRANQHPARSRQARKSIAAPRDAGEQMTLGSFAAAVLVGFLFMFSFMWLAAAY